MHKITALLLAAAAAGTLVMTASASALCYVQVKDDTPGTYPGGMHVYTNCLDK